jgi:ABC-type bacteriocin/lantibiotic exporter with double-glycine peptidase domain
LRKLIANIWVILTAIEKRKLMILGSSIVVINMIDIVSLALLVVIVNYYTIASAKLPDFIPGWLHNKSSVNLIGLFLLVFAVKSIIGYFVSSFQFKFIYSVASRLSAENLLRYLEGSFIDYVNIDSAVQIRQISQQPVEFGHYVLSGLLQMFTECVLIILTVVAILLYDAGLFLLLLVSLLPAVILISFLARRRLRHIRVHLKTIGEKAIQYLKEALLGYVESNIYNKKSFFMQRYADYQQKLNNFLSDIQVIQGLPTRSVEVFAVLGLFILLAINQRVNTGLVSIVTIGAFIAAAYKIIPGIVKVVNLNNQVRTYLFTVSNLGYRRSKSRSSPSSKAIDSIEFHSVGFLYEGKEVLKNLDLQIQKGEMVGISSPSGRGKTTLINLMLGFLEPAQGEILFNNEETSHEERKQFWKEISYVKQQPFLIYNTILNNITLDEVEPDKQLVKFAVDASGLDDLIKKNELGIHAIISENGKNISGGQRQRIALARAFYKNASLIILDEPFNEMDEASETKILHHLKNLCAEGKTIILITHNKRSLSFCTKIFPLNES